MLSRWIKFVVKWPRCFVGAAFILTVAACVALPRTVHIDNSFDIWLSPQAAKLQSHKELAAKLGEQVKLVVTLETPAGLEPRSNKFLLKLHDELAALPFVVHVESIVNHSIWYRQSGQLYRGPIVDANGLLAVDAKLPGVREQLQDLFVSENNQATRLFIYIGQADWMRRSNLQTKLIDHVHGMLRSYERQGHKLYLTGVPVIEREAQKMVAVDFSRLLPILVALLFVVFTILFKGWQWPLLAGLVVLLPALLATLLPGFFGLGVNVITSMLPKLILVLCFLDLLHIANAYHLVKAEHSAGYAIEQAIQSTWKPCLLTSVTTAVGFLALAVSDVLPIRHFGIFAAISIVVALFVTVTVAAAWVTLTCPRQVYRFPHGTHWFLEKFSSYILQYRKVILALALLALLFSSIKMLPLRMESDPRTFFGPNHRYMQAIQFVEKNFGGIQEFLFVLESEKDVNKAGQLQAVSTFAEAVAAHGYVRSVRSSNDYFRLLNEIGLQREGLPETDADLRQLENLSFLAGGDFSLANRLRHNNMSLVLAKTDFSSSGQSLAIEKFADDWLNHNQNDLNWHTVGKAPLYAYLQQLVLKNFYSSFAVCFAGVFLLIAFLFRSFSIFFIATFANLLPIVLVLAGLKVVGLPLDMATCMVASLALGIIVDDTIHFVFRYQQALSKRLESIECIRFAFRHAGTAIVYTSIILIIGFISLVFSEVQHTVRLGITMSAIVIGAIVADLVLLPAALSLLGGKKMTSQILTFVFLFVETIHSLSGMSGSLQWIDDGEVVRSQGVELVRSIDQDVRLVAQQPHTVFETLQLSHSTLTFSTGGAFHQISYTSAADHVLGSPLRVIDMQGIKLEKMVEPVNDALLDGVLCERHDFKATNTDLYAKLRFYWSKESGQLVLVRFFNKYNKLEKNVHYGGFVKKADGQIVPTAIFARRPFSNDGLKFLINQGTK